MRPGAKCDSGSHVDPDTKPSTRSTPTSTPRHGGGVGDEDSGTPEEGTDGRRKRGPWGTSTTDPKKQDVFPIRREVGRVE